MALVGGGSAAGAVSIPITGVVVQQTIVVSASLLTGMYLATHGHHLLPRQFEDQFNRAGLDIEDYKIDLPDTMHTLKPNGIHTGPRATSWNGHWDAFFKRFPNAKAPQILAELARLRKLFGI
jgi:hypothetical protein